MTTEMIPLGEADALIDRADAELVAGFHWRVLSGAGKTQYAHAWNRHLHIYMHRLVAGAGPTEQVDHRNGNGLDNRKANLRIATKSGNGANRPKDSARHRAEFTSQWKGVYWDRSRRRWVAMIHVNGCSRSLGRFTDEIAAARAYDEAATGAWGEFARLNFVD